MGLIQDAIRNIKQKKADKESYERGEYVKEDYAKKKLSSNERELVRTFEEERQRKIKAELDIIHKQENERVWSGKLHNPISAPNVVAGQKNLFAGRNMFSNCPSAVHQPNVVKGRNIFVGNRNIFAGGRRI